MASVAHVAVGLCAGRLVIDRDRDGGVARGLALCLGLCALALLPDADVIAFRLRIPYSAPFGHRGASHSLLAALVAGGCAGALLRWLWRGRVSLALALGVCLAVALSHTLLDSLTDGGLGVALFWPFDNRRFFAPWRPIPVAPIGRRLASAWGLRVLATESLWCLPLWLYALRPRR